MSTLPLDLYAEVITAGGVTYRWGANQAPGSRPQNLSFRTKIGEGFSDAGVTLARRIDKDYPDLNLVDTIVLVGADGSVAYEGRVSAQPREVAETHSISVQLAGWMAHAKDRKFTEVYVDRDRGAWGGMSLGRRMGLASLNYTPFDGEQNIDPTDSESGVKTGWNGGWAAPYFPLSEMWYDAGAGNTISRLSYRWKRPDTATTNNSDANWSWLVGVSSEDKAISTELGANLRAAGPGAGAFAPSSRRRYALLQTAYLATPAGSDNHSYGIAWYKLAVYGNHNLTLYTGEPGEPEGVVASDVIGDIVGRFCPALNTAGVQATSYVIQHLAFKDRTFPYDALLEVNKYHLWHLGVWENRTLVFRPYDLTDYDWEIRTDDPGTSFTPQGPSVDSVFNGVVVTYADILTGVKNVLTPDAFADLKDTDVSNPWNQQNISHWDEIELSAPTLQAQALQIGRTVLGDRMRPKSPGTITVKGYVRDRAGNEQPGWKVRAGETIGITNFPNDQPRLIHETTWDADSKQLTLSLDAPASAVDALFDRIGNALTARGLT